MDQDTQAAGAAATLETGGRLVWWALFALCASVFAFSISFGGLTPLISVTLDGRGVDGTVIGLVVAAQPLGTILAAPFAPWFLRRFGAADAMLLCGAVSLASIVLLPVFDTVPAWFALRLVAGLAGAAPWIILETWINVIATERDRARIISIYMTVMAAGFAAGPMVLSVIGTDGVTPFVVFIVLKACALVPIVFLRARTPDVEVEHRTRYAGILLAAPVLFAAAFVAGFVDAGFFAFLPIWGLRNGLEEWLAVLLLTVFVSGNIVLQFPLGWLADTVGYRVVLLGCGLVCVVGALAAPYLLVLPVALGVVLFVWGGCAWGLYTIALAAIGDRFRGGSLAAANAVFVIAYEVAFVAAPPASGAAADLRPADGLMGLMAIVGAGFVILLLGRSLIAVQRTPDG